MPAYDEIFIEAFKKQFIEHFKVSEGENNPADLITSAKSGDVGKLSRMFDSLILPTLDKTSLLMAIEEAGGVTSFMHLMLDEAAKVLLVADHSKLQDPVIEAIGRENYNKIIQSKVKDINNAAEVSQVEQEISRQILASIAVNYSAALSQIALTPEESMVQKSNNALSDKIFALKGMLKKHGALPDGWSNDLSPAAFTNTNQFIETSKSLAERIDRVLADEDTSPQAMLDLLKQAHAQKEAGALHYEPSEQKFSVEVIFPIQQIATNFLRELKASTQTVEDMIAQVEKVKECVNSVLTELVQIRADYRTKAKINDATFVPSVDDPIRLMEVYIDQLDTALETPGTLEGSPPEAIIKKMEGELGKATTGFLSSAQRIQPAEELLPTWIRFLRALFTIIPNHGFSMTTATERADKARYSQQTTLLKEKIESIKENDESKDDTEESINLKHPG